MAYTYCKRATHHPSDTNTIRHPYAMHPIWDLADTSDGCLHVFLVRDGVKLFYFALCTTHSDSSVHFVTVSNDIKHLLSPSATTINILCVSGLISLLAITHPPTSVNTLSILQVFKTLDSGYLVLCTHVRQL